MSLISKSAPVLANHTHAIAPFSNARKLTRLAARHPGPGIFANGKGVCFSESLPQWRALPSCETPAEFCPSLSFFSCAP
jgi:hypothetical protein